METPLSQPLLRGLKGQCPCCGRGKLFGAFLKTFERCAECGEPFHHHRADDFPPYIVIFLLGHILVPLALAIEEGFAPPEWVYLAFFIPLTVVLAIALLQPVKGLVVALQWHMGMHGFKESKERRDAR